MSLVSLRVWLSLAGFAALLIGLVALYDLGHRRGEALIQSQWDAEILNEKVAAAKLQDRSHLVTTMVLTQYIDRTQVLLTEGATITREVTRYVSPEADRHCTVPVGFVRVLNAAAGGQALDAQPSAGAYDAAAGLALSDTSGYIADNYVTCRADQERLRSLQSWISQQLDAQKEKGP